MVNSLLAYLVAQFVFIDRNSNVSKELSSQEYIDYAKSIKQRVSDSRYKAARSVNSELILLYHHIGTEILKKQEIQGWGSKVVELLSKDLKSEFPEMKGFSCRNLKYMRRFAQEYPEIDFVQQVAAQLPWFHLVVLIDKIKNPDVRGFYINKAIEHGWSRSEMVHQVELNLYSRQGKAISNFEEKLPAKQSDLAQQTLKDPYLFDFLSLGEEALERDIEKGLVQHMEKFLLELGAGFAFVGRQYHLEVGDDDFYLDLLFYHLKLRSYIVIELKADRFKPEYAGKMNFYLSAVDDLLKHPSDNPSIGLILCKTKNEVLAEYALRDMSKAIGLAEYKLTEALPDELKTSLPTIDELEAELSKEITDQSDNEDK